MAYADGEFHELEKSVIHEKMKRLFPNEVNLEEKLQTILSQYQNFNKADLKILFSDTFNHFTNVKFSQKYKVYSDMYDIINADGKVDEAETKALNALKEIIEIGN
jgi:uncharacterized tellurite resistance protein B-like protein